MNLSRSNPWPNLTGGPVVPKGQGIDYLIVSDDQLSLRVYFLEAMPHRLEDVSIFRIEGGDRITTISITAAQIVVDPAAKDYLKIDLACFGDWSPYRFTIDERVWQELDLDPVFASVVFSFKINCPKDVDCKVHDVYPEGKPKLRDFDYLAKDYESFKQAMLDRAPLIMPDWWDRAEADFAVALVDLLAYAGDRLSYYQDRVAAESLLKTARARQSVAAHLKLIDYALDPGESAAVYVYFEADRDMTVPANSTMVKTAALSTEEPVVFSLAEPLSVYLDLNKGVLRFFEFDHPSLVIPKGATEATLAGSLKGIDTGSLFIFETKSSGKHLVKLSAKPVYKNGPDGSPVTVIIWGVEDALPWDVPLLGSAIYGNVALCLQGQQKQDTFSVEALTTGKTDPAGYEGGGIRYHDLEEGPLAYKDGLPMIKLTVDDEVWEAVSSLAQSEAYDHHYQVMDMDNGKNRILFGDNKAGMRPMPYAWVEITYRTAKLGSEANVAQGVLTGLVEEVKGVKKVVNPFEATGARAPETEDHGKLWGPKLIGESKRAVTPEDYEKETASVTGVSRAMARFVWTGSWFTVRVTIDPTGTEEVSDELKQRVLDHLRTRKMAGYDLHIASARYAPLEIALSLCLTPMAFKDEVKRDILRVLGNGMGPDGAKGFFHPDNWTFGKPLRLSALYAAIASVEGIECAEVTVFKRLLRPQGNELNEGFIAMVWDEIICLDNDRNFPERGVLDVEMAGGR